MSDAHFDGMRANGEYPPKGWGWGSVEFRSYSLLRRFRGVLKQNPDLVDPWVLDEVSGVIRELEEKYEFWIGL